MEAPLAEEELELLRRVAAIQEEELVNFCIELDIVPDEPFRVDDVIDSVFEALLERATGSGGLPVSKYDADDLAPFDRSQLEAFARGLGVRVGANFTATQIVDQVIKSMKKARRKLPRRSQIPLMLPYFLPALVRHFSSN